MEVVDRARIDGGFVAYVVGRAVAGAAFDAAAGHPGGEAEGVVVAAFAALSGGVGIRPNSVVQRTSVSSSIPRRFRSLIRAAVG